MFTAELIALVGTGLCTLPELMTNTVKELLFEAQQVLLSRVTQVYCTVSIHAIVVI